MTEASSVATTPWPTQLRPLIEDALDRFLPGSASEPLHRAIRYAVFSGGKRLRPQLLLLVGQACGLRPAEQDLALRAACAVELIHVASLVHDDLPCFDNAAERRGRPSVHILFGEARALLVGDALLAYSFELLAGAARSLAARSLRLVQLLAGATGASSGLVGGQGLEHDRAAGAVAPEGAARYHAMKSGALFGMAAESAAVAAGSRAAKDWAGIGWLVGRGYQLAHTLTSLSHSEPSATLLQVDAAPSCQSPGWRHAQGSLQAQLRAVSATLRERITALTAQPEPLLEFLDGLCAPLLQSSGTQATAILRGQPDELVQPAAGLPRRPDLSLFNPD